MKFYLPVIALSLSSVFAVETSKTAYMQGVLKDVVLGAGHSNIRGTQFDRGLQRQVCLPEFEYTSESGCTIAGLRDFVITLDEALNDNGCPHNFMIELRLVLGGVSVEEVWTFFWLQCFNFWSSQESMNFADIGDGTDVFIKAFFDGMFQKSFSNDNHLHALTLAVRLPVLSQVEHTGTKPAKPPTPMATSSMFFQWILVKKSSESRIPTLFLASLICPSKLSISRNARFALPCAAGSRIATMMAITMETVRRTTARMRIQLITPMSVILRWKKEARQVM